MGCTPEQQPCISVTFPIHTVRIPSFWLGKYEVTQGVWSSVMNANPANYLNCGLDCPIENVSIYDCATFCNKLSVLSNLEPVYYFDAELNQIFDTIVGYTLNETWTSLIEVEIYVKESANGFRLPTEAEWEYVARGGNSPHLFKYAGSNDLDAISWHNTNSNQQPHPIGQKQGLMDIFDLSGNIWERCIDKYTDIHALYTNYLGDWHLGCSGGAQGVSGYVCGTDLCNAPSSAHTTCLKGGAFWGTPDVLPISTGYLQVNALYRAYTIFIRDGSIGFRLARNPD